MKEIINMVKNIMIGIMNINLVIMWCILFPFIYIFDRLFGGWKNEKEKNDTRTS